VTERNQPYIGTELELFSGAKNWKAYWSALVRGYVHGRVLEVGAGLGANIPLLVEQALSWTALEPDAELARQIPDVTVGVGPGLVQVVHVTLAAVTDQDLYESILYIDVLEHIEDDLHEFQEAAQHLKHGGHLIVLAPAHARLYSSFDRAVGHFRRYSRTDFELRLRARGITLEQLIFVDSVGALLSLGNRTIARQEEPRIGQILFWDRFLIPVSRVLDRLLRYRTGRTIIGVWRRVGGESSSLDASEHGNSATSQTAGSSSTSIADAHLNSGSISLGDSTKRPS